MGGRGAWTWCAPFVVDLFGIRDFISFVMTSLIARVVEDGAQDDWAFLD